MSEFNVKYKEYLDLFNSALQKYCDTMSFKPQVLSDAMRYSLLLGGKRIRPVLLLASSDMLGLNTADVMNFAIAIEMIHTYSLIHDDLPAMDNDDFRRGKPSNHKVFGEANAILAGDALLNTAFSICFGECSKGERYIVAAKYLCDCAGAEGMIAGQVADIECSGKDKFGEKELEFIYEHKTGKLLAAPLAISGIIAGSKYFLELENFGTLFGNLFQLTDDILDVTGTFENLGKTTGKDKEEKKLTYVNLYGLDNADIQADILAEKCNCILEAFDCDTSFLGELVNFTRTRKK